MADLDGELKLVEQEIGELKSRLAEAVVQENEANRIHSQQQHRVSSSFTNRAASFQDEQTAAAAAFQQQHIVHQQIMNQIAQNKLTLMTRLRRAESQLTMLRMQQRPPQSNHSMFMSGSAATTPSPYLVPQQPTPSSPFIQANNLFHSPSSNNFSSSPFHSRSSQQLAGVETQRFLTPPHPPSRPLASVAPRSENEMIGSRGQLQQQYSHSQRYPPQYSLDINHPRFTTNSTRPSLSSYQDEFRPHSEQQSPPREPLAPLSTKYHPHSPQQGAPPSSITRPGSCSSGRTLGGGASDNAAVSSSSSSPSSKEFFVNNRELFNRARYNSEPEYREWCLKYNIVSINDHGVKRQQMAVAAEEAATLMQTTPHHHHSSLDSDYRCSSNLMNSRGDSDFRQQSFQTKTTNSFNHSTYNPELELSRNECFDREVCRNNLNTRNVAPRQTVVATTQDIDDRSTSFSSTNQFSHRPLSECSQKVTSPISSSNAHPRTLGSSYRGGRERDAVVVMCSERDRTSVVDPSKFEQEFFDENHGPEPGHPYYHIWYNKFIKKASSSSGGCSSSSRHSLSTGAVVKKLADSDYRNMSQRSLNGGSGSSRRANPFRAAGAAEQEQPHIRIVTPPPHHSRLHSSRLKNSVADMDLDEERRERNDRSSRRRYRGDESEMMELDDDDNDAPPPLPPPPVEPPPEAPEKPADVYQLDQMLSVPGRVEQQRLRNTLIIIRGPPGSGKSHLAKIIKDKEVAAGMTPPRILSIDDYFMVADEGSKGEMVFEYEAEMEEVYLSALAKAFSKTVSEGKDRLVIIDACNHLQKHFSQFVDIAQQNLIKVFLVELQPSMAVCLEQNVHKRSEDDIKNIIVNWEDAPNTLPRLDASHFMKKQNNNNSSSKKDENKSEKDGESGKKDKTDGYSRKSAVGTKTEGGGGTHMKCWGAGAGAVEALDGGDVFGGRADDKHDGGRPSGDGARKRQRSDSLELSDAEQEDTKEEEAEAKNKRRNRSSGAGATRNEEEKRSATATTYTFAAAPNLKPNSNNNNVCDVKMTSSSLLVDESYYDETKAGVGSTQAESSCFSPSSTVDLRSATGASSDDVIGSSCSAASKERDGSDSDSDCSSSSDYSAAPLFCSSSSSSSFKLKKQVQVVKSKWEILDNTEHDNLDKMDGLGAVVSKENKTKKSGDIEHNRASGGGNDSDYSFDDASGDDDVDNSEDRIKSKSARVRATSPPTGSSRRETIEDFLSSCGSEYFQRTPIASGKSSGGGAAKKRVRWADVEERREIEQEKRLGFIVGRTNWHRLLNEEQATTAALTKTKFI